MIRFVTPTENLFKQLQFIDIAVKLAGIPIDWRTLAFGRQMLEKIGEVQAICYQCGIIGHIHDFYPNQHLTLDLEARNKWICIPDCGKLVEGPNLQRKSTNKYQSRRGAPILPPLVMASFAAARSNPQSPRLEEVPNQSTMKEKPLNSASVALALEHLDGTEKTLKRKKVYEEKGKAKVSELEKEPKKLLLGHKGIMIRVLDEEAFSERDSTFLKDRVPDSLEEMADIDYPVEERNHKEQVSDIEKARSTLVKELFGMSGVETNKIWYDQESNEDDVSPWVSRINTYGTNEGTIGEMLREKEGLHKEG
ncbi:hypothetical protein LINPERHAP1_LOCUS28909 [Linum perenne]